MRTDFQSRYWTLSAIGLALVLAFRCVCWLVGWEPQDDGTPYRYAYPAVKRVVPDSAASTPHTPP